MLFVEPYKPGRESNISSKTDKEKDRGTPVSELPTDNIRSDEIIRIYGCKTALGQNNIAQAFANHFGVSVWGVDCGLSFGRWGFGGKPRPIKEKGDKGFIEVHPQN